MNRHEEWTVSVNTHSSSSPPHPPSPISPPAPPASYLPLSPLDFVQVYLCFQDELNSSVGLESVENLLV